MLASTSQRVNLWRNAFSSPYGDEIEPTITAISEAISDDLDTPRAFTILDDWAKKRVELIASAGSDSLKVSAIGQMSRFLDAVLGIAF